MLMYSYGSGISATMLSLVGRTPSAPRFSLLRLQAMVRGRGGVGWRVGDGVTRPDCVRGRLAEEDGGMASGVGRLRLCCAMPCRAW